MQSKHGHNALNRQEQFAFLRKVEQLRNESRRLARGVDDDVIRQHLRDVVDFLVDLIDTITRQHGKT